MNWHITPPTPESHPDFPLWRKGYTPDQVYELFFPTDFRFLCNPARPAVCGRFGLPADCLWRFEFVVQPGEDPETMASEEEIKKIVYPYLTHPGHRYGLASEVIFPADCVNTLRARPFTFSARSCNQWALGRVMLAGDSCHVMPPFGGQGIAAGFRDASGLAWRLALLHRKPHLDHDALLRSWYVERKQQLDASLALTVRNGRLVINPSTTMNFLRDWTLWAVQLVPSWRHQLERGPRDRVTRYRYEKGLPFVFGVGGLNLPQVYAYDFRTKRVVFTDDLIFSPGGKGLFPLLAIVEKFEEVRAAVAEIEDVAALTGGLVCEHEATVLINVLETPALDNPAATIGADMKIARIASAAEFSAEVELSQNRPAPEGYDAFRLGRELGPSVRFVLLRPDRFVYAASRSGDELRHCVKRLSSDLQVGCVQDATSKL